MAAGAMAVMAGIGTLGWVLWPHHDTRVAAIPAQPPKSAEPPASLLEFPIESASEATIRRHVAANTTIFRLAANPNILVLDFASLRDQGLMLNRIGAFTEKAGLPHDRVLTDAALDKAIRDAGDTPETFYYGHDYSAAALARFFAAADRDRIPLNPREESLRRLLRQEGWFVAGKQAGLISIPRVGADARVTADDRAAILHHEVSHGEYFSNPAFAAHARRFWTSALTPAEQDAIRKFLRNEGYDTTQDDLVVNEAQAYLIFTHNPAFFAPATIGMTEPRRAELRALFMRDLPTAWLADQTPPAHPADPSKRSSR